MKSLVKYEIEKRIIILQTGNRVTRERMSSDLLEEKQASAIVYSLS